MSTNLIKVQLGGAKDAGGKVYLGDLKNICSHLSNCLKSTEEAVSGEKPSLRYRVTELKISSAVLAVEPVVQKGKKRLASKTVALFSSTIAAIQNSQSVDKRIGSDQLDSFRSLVSEFLHQNRSLSIAGQEITTRFIANIDDILSAAITSDGSVKGTIERLNIHNRNEFALYPPGSENGINCSFDSDMFKQVHQAIDKNVTVSGKLHFRAGAAYPSHIVVERVDIHPPDDQLPSLHSLKGLLPEDFTRGLGVVEYTQMIRNE